MREYLKKALRRLPLLAATLSAAALIVAMPSVSAAGVKKGFLSALRAPCRRSIRSACSPLFRALGAVRLSRKISPKARAGSFRPARERGRGGVHELCRGLPRRRGNDRLAIFRRAHLTERRAENDPVLRQRRSGVCYRRSRRGYARKRSGGSHNFVSLTLASLTLGVLTRFIPHDETNKHAAPAISSLPLSRALTEAVGEGTKNMISICAWIVMFACTAQYIPLLCLPDWANLLLGCTLEVTGGCASAAGVFNIPAIAAVLGWGGVSVHCQIMRHIKTCGTPLPYFSARALSAPLSPRCSARDCSACSLVP